jgi:sugar phosphate isomerase/epimerase
MAFATGTWDVYPCALLTFLASLREADDLDEMALDWIERWIGRTPPDIHRVRALAFNGLALYTFGRLPQAIDATERALALAETRGLEEFVHQCKANVAHYLAELGPDPADVREGLEDRRGKRAQKLIEDAMQVYGPNVPPKLLQTAGFVRIVFGASGADIQEGLALSRAARDGDPTDQLVAKFVEHDEELAERRLDQIKASDERSQD